MAGAVARVIHTTMPCKPDDDERELGYLLAVAAAAVWTPRPLVAMLEALGGARALVAYARSHVDAGRLTLRPACEHLGREALQRVAAIGDAEAARALETAQAHGIRFVTSRAAAYPALLRDLCDPPPVIYYRGSLKPLDGRCLAIVGSRAATSYGRTVAAGIARGCAAYDACVLSGLARGIDAAAHRAANAAGIPGIAVLGSGVCRVYPPYHARLADELAASGGGIVSEFPPDMAARAHHFPMRNRLVAALAHATVVVEAGSTSGALITARLAAELGRPVFAVPGDLGRSTSEGTNALIKDGAMLTTGAADIASVLGWTPLAPAGAREDNASPPVAGRKMLAPSGGDCRYMTPDILGVMAAGGCTIDEVCAQTGLDAASVAAQLTLLEMQGLVERRPGGLFVPSSNSSGTLTP
jgi:DNA processing protein